jgi:hypothetical protein
MTETRFKANPLSSAKLLDLITQRITLKDGFTLDKEHPQVTLYLKG